MPLLTQLKQSDVDEHVTKPAALFANGCKEYTKADFAGSAANIRGHVMNLYGIVAVLYEIF